MITEVQRQAWERYKTDHSEFLAVADDMQDCLVKVVSSAGIDAEVSARAKDVASFAKKMIVKAYADPWAQVTDKVAARIVVGLRAEQERVLEAIKAEPALEIVGDIDDKAAALRSDQFRYASIHFQLAVPGRENGRHPDLECEVQLRTRAQHIWAVSEHKMVYKGVIATPDE
ncbi:MAG TPA: hypothetical protein VHO91_17235, partial [Rhodopila sp.]|nr:hypothetical protein [Rhodopila sp.]